MIRHEHGGFPGREIVVMKQPARPKEAKDRLHHRIKGIVHGQPGSRRTDFSSSRDSIVPADVRAAIRRRMIFAPLSR